MNNMYGTINLPFQGDVGALHLKPRERPWAEFTWAFSPPKKKENCSGKNSLKGQIILTQWQGLGILVRQINNGLKAQINAELNGYSLPTH